MSSTDSDDAKRISTYVPSEQKSEWKEHADELDMTQSEFIRTMVQAGRRNFTVTPSSSAHDGTDSEHEKPVESLQQRIVAALESHGPLEWDTLIEQLTESIESDVEQHLDELQEVNRVRYSGRDGGYMLIGDTDE